MYGDKSSLSFVNPLYGKVFIDTLTALCIGSNILHRIPKRAEILTKTAQFPQSQKLSFIQVTNLVLLSQVHKTLFATCPILQRKPC